MTSSPFKPPLVSVVILTHNSERYLETLFRSLREQTYSAIEVIVAENYSTDRTRSMLAHLRPTPNVLINDDTSLWFSKPNNRGIQASRGKYVLICNHDITLHPSFITELVNALELDPKAGSAIGKVLKMHPLKKSPHHAMIDTTGTQIFRSRRAVDRGESQDDGGQFDRPGEVFGGSGALTLYRRAALDEVATIDEPNPPEFFDEDFNAFQEDIDLSWRLQSAGWVCVYVPSALAWHARTAAQRKGLSDLHAFWNRRTKSSVINYLSYRNHGLLLLKNERASSLTRDFPFIAWYEFKKLFYLIFFEQKTLKALPELWRLRKRLQRKRQHIEACRRVSSSSLSRRWFH